MHRNEVGCECNHKNVRSNCKECKKIQNYQAKNKHLLCTTCLHELGKKTNGYQRIQGQYTGLIKVRSDKITNFVKFYQSLDRSRIYDGGAFNNMYMTLFLQLLIDAGWSVKAAIVQNGWLEIDTIEDIELYEKLFEQDRLKAFYNMENL